MAIRDVVQRTPWTQQPQYPTRLNSDLGLTYFINPSNRADSVANRVPGFVGSASLTAGIGGLGLNSPAGVNPTDLVLNDSLIVPLNTCTIFLHLQKLGAPSVAGEFGTQSTVISTRAGAHVPYTDGNVYWDFGGATAGTNRVVATTPVIGNDVWAFTTGPRGMEIWQNGVLLASNAANPTRTSGAINFGLGYHAASGVSAAAFICFAFGVSSKQLDSSTLKSLTASPAGLWAKVSQAQPRRMWAAAAASSITGTSTATILLAGGAAGVLALSGTSAAQVALTGAATGAASIAGVSAASVVLTGTAAGTTAGSITGTSAQALQLTGDAAGALGIAAFSNQQFTLAGVATGTTTGGIAGTSAASLLVTGSSAAVLAVAGTSAQTLPITGSGTAALNISAASSQQIVVTGAAAGTASTGTGTGATAAQIWGYVMANGQTAEANMLAMLAALNTTLPVNVTKVNGVTIKGAGVAGNAWGPV